MTFADGWAYALSRYATVTGRATRTEYWSFTALQFGWYLAVIVTAPLAASEAQVGWVMFLSLLFFLIPNLTVTVRRLHDLGLTGWLMLVGLVPLGGIALFVAALWPSQQGDNRYGPDPHLDGPGRGDGGDGGSRIPRTGRDE